MVLFVCAACQILILIPVQINKFIVDTSEQRDEDKVVDD